MEGITVAQDVLNLIQSDHGEIGEDLTTMERLVKAQTDQLGRQALQAHLDRHGKLGYVGSRRRCSCGQQQRFVEYRPRTLESVLGEVTLHRAYYHCPSCHQGGAPYDEQAGLGAMAVSPGLAKMACELSVDLPFAKSAAKLMSLTGRQLSASSIERLTKRAGATADRIEQAQAARMEHWQAPPEAPAVAGRIYVSVDGVMAPMREGWEEIKAAVCYWRDAAGTVHRRYRARTEKIDGFVPHAWAVAAACGLAGCRESVLLGDGATWIWERIGPVIDPKVQIVDWYHAGEHLWAAGQVVHGEGTAACQGWVEGLKNLLWEGRIDGLLGQLDRTLTTVRSPAKRAALQDLRGYIQGHRPQMAYDRFRAMGLDIGSGMIESACRTVVQERLKRPGTRWHPPNAQRVLSLRVCHLNGQWDSFWANRPLVAA
jgi:hypothetical protein